MVYITFFSKLLTMAYWLIFFSVRKKPEGGRVIFGSWLRGQLMTGSAIDRALHNAVTKSQPKQGKRQPLEFGGKQSWSCFGVTQVMQPGHY